MATTKKKTATKTAKKTTAQPARTRCAAPRAAAKKEAQPSNTFFLISMSFLAATLLVVNLLMLNA